MNQCLTLFSNLCRFFFNVYYYSYYSCRYGDRTRWLAGDPLRLGWCPCLVWSHSSHQPPGSQPFLLPSLQAAFAFQGAGFVWKHLRNLRSPFSSFKRPGHETRDLISKTSFHPVVKQFELILGVSIIQGFSHKVGYQNKYIFYFFRVLFVV